MAVRVTQVALEVLRDFDPDIDTTVYVTQVALEVFKTESVTALSISHADDMNALYENPNVPGYSVPFKWQDGIEFFLEGEDQQLYIAVDDLNNNLSDKLSLGQGHAFTDDLDNWSDVVSIAHGLLLQAFDSMFYSWSDAIQIAYLLAAIVADDLNNWSDIVLTNRSSTIPGIGDSISFGDSLSMRMAGFKEFSDSMTLSDSVVVSLTPIMSFADDLDNWADAVSVVAIENIPISVTDDLNSWSDLTGKLLAGSDVSYLRRYLNDVQL